MENKSNYSGGIGFFGLLTLLFIGLKLGNVITWSWFWVLSPLFIIPLFALTVFMLVTAIVLIKEVMKIK